jgi:hypothetical protein
MAPPSIYRGPDSHLLGTPTRCTCCGTIVIERAADFYGRVHEFRHRATDSAGRCGSCVMLDASVCPGCGVHVYAYERDANGRCEECAQAVAEEERLAMLASEIERDRFDRSAENWADIAAQAAREAVL